MKIDILFQIKGLMKITIQGLNNRIIVIEVEPNDTIESGKEKYKKKAGINDDLQWKFGGGPLDNDKTFDYYYIQDQDLITSNTTREGGKIYLKL